MRVLKGQTLTLRPYNILLNLYLQELLVSIYMINGQDLVMTNQSRLLMRLQLMRVI